MNVWRELWATLCDVWKCGDLPGHLAAWWAVATGQVTASGRVRLVAK